MWLSTAVSSRPCVGGGGDGEHTLEELDILGAIYTLQPVANLVLVPMSRHVSDARGW